MLREQYYSHTLIIKCDWCHFHMVVMFVLPTVGNVRLRRYGVRSTNGVCTEFHEIRLLVTKLLG